jgi:hypothetical protein
MNGAAGPLRHFASKLARGRRAPGERSTRRIHFGIRCKEDGMTAGSEQPADRPEFSFLERDETVEIVADTPAARLLVTDRRLAVATEDRVALDIGFAGLRRSQFDIERHRPATLLIVPENPTDEPQVLGIPPNRYDEVTRALAIVGRRLAEGN